MSDISECLPEGLTPEAKKERQRFLNAYRYHLETVKKLSLSILIWGIGYRSESLLFQKRVEIRQQLLKLGFNAMFSEELGQDEAFSQKILEFAQARAADLVIILLENSPGALGEAHDFANHPDLIQKTYVIAPDRYRESYSGVGAIRLLEEAHGGVYWYNDDELRACRVTLKAIRRAEARRQLEYLRRKYEFS